MEFIDKIKQKPEKYIVENIKEGLRNWFYAIEDIKDKYEEGFEKAETINELMQLKKELLINILEELPLNPTTCYFCIKNHYNYQSTICKTCEYGKEYGICAKANSSYDRIIHVHQHLIETIDTKYWREYE